MNGVDTEVLAEHAPGAGVRIVVDDDAVQAIGILRGTVAVDGHLHSQAARVRADLRDGFLGSHRSHARLKGCE